MACKKFSDDSECNSFLQSSKRIGQVTTVTYILFTCSVNRTLINYLAFFSFILVFILDSDKSIASRQLHIAAF